MPLKPPRPCKHPGCINLTADDYCEDHASESHKRYDKHRPNSSQRGYGAQWQKLRLIVLRRSPLCVDPYGIHAAAHETVVATDVDHIIPKPQGKDTLDNLQSLCHSCHSRKTAEQSSGWGAGG